MSLRIPLTPDQTLQTEFHEIERRLRRLEKRTGTTAGNTTIQVLGGGSAVAPNLSSILNRLDALEAALAAIPDPDEVDIPVFGGVGPSSSTGVVPEPGVAVPPTGVAEHVLIEDATWGFPLRGLVSVATSGEQTVPPHDVVDVAAGLHVAGPIVAPIFDGSKYVAPVILDGDGNIIAPAIAFNSETGFGFYRVAPGTLGLAQGGATRHVYTPTGWVIGGDMALSSAALGTMLLESSSIASTKAALHIKARVAQTANLQEWQNPGGTPLAAVDKDGKIYTGSVFWASGTGDPEGAVTAPAGSLFSRTNGGAATTLYIKETGTGNTGWVDTTWGFPLRGLIGVSTPGEQTDPPYDVVNIEAALHTQALTAADIECYDLIVNGSVLYRDTFWEDLRFPAQGINPIGSPAPPGIDASSGLLSFSGTTDNVIAGVAQMPHSWRKGTGVHPHVHLRFAASNPGTNTRWQFRYDVAAIDGNFANAVGTYTSLTAVTVANPSSTTKHVYADLGDVPMTGIGESGIILWQVWRLANSDAADNDTGAVFLTEFDIHFEVEKPGTVNEIP